MMTKRVSVGQARANLADLIGAVYYGKEPVVVERKGKPMAVWISPEQFEQFEEYQKQARERFFQATDELQRLNADEDPDAVLRDVTEIVEQVRRERYEREQR
jgi:prevent-host-death family protein